MFLILASFMNIGKFALSIGGKLHYIYACAVTPVGAEL
jgi:hypothetical protein